MQSEKIPKDKTFFPTLALLQEGYLFISNRREHLGSDIFETSLLFQKAICIGGKGATELLYDTSLFERKNATPLRVQKTLTGVGGVQGLDNETHKKRKAAFLSLMTTEKIELFDDLLKEELQAAAKIWETKERIILFDEMQQVLFRSACLWSGIPEEFITAAKAKDMGCMIDAFGATGARYWHGRWARKKAESWAMEIIQKARNGAIKVKEATALHVFSFYKDIDQKPLSLRIAAIELLNIVRPMTAMATFSCFIAHALHFNSATVKNILNDPDYPLLFIQEVRRLYPFTPAVGARSLKKIEWKGYVIPAKTLVVLDVYGIDHDRRFWGNPNVFNPERFRNLGDNPHFIPQGGGQHATGHRCAGEWVTIKALQTILSFLVSGIDYTMPGQNFSIDLSRMPTLPASRIILQNISSN